MSILFHVPSVEPSCPASANLGTEVYGPISNLCSINEDPWPEDPPGLATGTTTRLMVPFSEFNGPGVAGYYDLEITLQSHPTLDLSVLAFIMGNRNMAGEVYEFDTDPVFQAVSFTISAGVDEVLTANEYYWDPVKDIIFEISYTDNQGGDWSPVSTNKIAGHFAYYAKPLNVFEEITNDTGRRGIVSLIVEV